MIVYVDSSAAVKLYVEESQSEDARALVGGRPWVCAAHTYAEIRRGLWHALAEPDRMAACTLFEADWDEVHVVDIDETLCRRAAELIETTGVKTMDALHLAAAERAGTVTDFVTFDRRQAGAARALGWRVLPE